jgi:aminobenzoyl-glutamate utilization protein B
MEEVTNRVRKIEQGAALMTETTLEERFENATSAVLNNHSLADLQYKNMQLVGPIHFSEEEFAYAQKINDGFPPEISKDFFNTAKSLKLPDEIKRILEKVDGQPLVGENFYALDEDAVETGSTDVGDLSRVTPLSMLYTACHTTGAPGHSWANVATGAMSIGHKGMLHAAKIMAASAVDLFTETMLLQAARAEFAKATGGKPYRSSIPDAIRPPHFPNPERDVD